LWFSGQRVEQPLARAVIGILVEPAAQRVKLGSFRKTPIAGQFIL
jgi:hypothetical protein